MIRFWRLSQAMFADRFDGGYGLRFSGRWNARGHPVTYCATTPALCVLEKLVHVERVGRLEGTFMMVAYEAPAGISLEVVELDDLRDDWRENPQWTRQRGEAWIGRRGAALLRVPSVVVAEPAAPDRNLVVNHAHPDATQIRTIAQRPFRFDPRLYRAAGEQRQEV